MLRRLLYLIVLLALPGLAGAQSSDYIKYYPPAGLSTMTGTATTTTSTVPFLLPDGTASAPSLAFSSESALGLYRTASGTIGFSLGAVGRPQIVMSYGNNTLQFVSTAALAWNSGSTALNGSNDVSLASDAAASASR